jgi:hypothetical protein
VWACGRVGVWACGRVGVWACGRDCRVRKASSFSLLVPRESNTPPDHEPSAKKRKTDYEDQDEFEYAWEARRIWDRRNRALKLRRTFNWSFPATPCRTDNSAAGAGKTGYPMGSQAISPFPPIFARSRNRRPQRTRRRARRAQCHLSIE